MAGIGSYDGLTIEFYTPDGKRDKTRPPKHFERCWLTAQPQGVKNVGSEDWLNEVYLAPDEQSLYQLMRNNPPAGTLPLFTTGSSHNVTLYFFDSGAEQPPESFYSAIGEGHDHKITGPGGQKENVRVFDTVAVTNGDAGKPGNGLNKRWKKASPFRLKIARPKVTVRTSAPAKKSRKNK